MKLKRDNNGTRISLGEFVYKRLNHVKTVLHIPEHPIHDAIDESTYELICRVTFSMDL